MAHNPDPGPSAARTVVVDLAVAATIFALGALVAWDSHRLGSGWVEDGPQSGYFPFYIGLLLCISSTVVFVQGVRKLGSDRNAFVTAPRFRQVLVILVPSACYVLGVQLIGIYVSSMVFIVLFMKIVGKYTWLRSTLVGAGVSVISFLLFEIWFKIPLPKGPVEKLLGY